MKKKREKPETKQMLFHLRRTFAPMVAGAAGLTLLATPLAVDANIPDERIARTIESDLAKYEGVASHLIDVESENGVVMLSGVVDHLLAKDQAVALTKSIKGVRGVVDRLEVSPVARTDAQIRSDVRTAIAEDPATESWDVQATVKDGQVTLNGDVESWQERMVAEQVAKSVRGVKSVTNVITYTPVNSRADSEIAADIRQRMKMDSRIDDLLVTVDVKDGVARLSGFVGSSSEKDLATNLAWVEGVNKVDGKLITVSHDKMRNEVGLRERTPSYSDREVMDAVQTAFSMDPRVKDANIDVEIEYGNAELYGTVSSFAGRLAAEQNARNTMGIHNVENRLKVRPDRWEDDMDVYKSVTAALKRNPYLDRSDIKVQVINGKVYLRGTVDNTFEVHEAYRVASRIQGVADIDNGLRATSNRPKFNSLDYSWYHYIPDSYYPIPATPTSIDAEIKSDVEEELFWSPFIDSDKITVEVEDGAVKLTGFVDDYVERRIATENAWEGGAKGVRNHLKVR